MASSTARSTFSTPSRGRGRPGRRAGVAQHPPGGWRPRAAQRGTCAAPSLSGCAERSGHHEVSASPGRALPATRAGEQVALQHLGRSIRRRSACSRSAVAAVASRARANTPPSGARRSASQVSRPLPACRSRISAWRGTCASAKRRSRTSPRWRPVSLMARMSQRSRARPVGEKVSTSPCPAPSSVMAASCSSRRRATRSRMVRSYPWSLGW